MNKMYLPEVMLIIPTCAAVNLPPAERRLETAAVYLSASVTSSWDESKGGFVSGLKCLNILRRLKLSEADSCSASLLLHPGLTSQVSFEPNATFPISPAVNRVRNLFILRSVSLLIIQLHFRKH